MANQGAKKRREENRKHMNNLLRRIIVCNVVFVVVRMLFFHYTFTWKHWVGLFLTSIGYAVPFQLLAKMASSAYDDNGELLDGGHDMSYGGVCGYLHDVTYITSFVQIMSIISGKFWYTYLVIPAFAIYQVSGFIKSLLSRSSEEPVEDERARNGKRWRRRLHGQSL